MVGSPCMPCPQGWTVEGGYRRISRDGKQVYAHKWVLEQKLGRPLRDGYETAHLCNNPPCWNESHLVEATHAENMAMRRDRQTHCKRGHELFGDNMTITNGRRRCKACARLYYHKGRPLKLALQSLRSKLDDFDQWLLSQDA